VVGLATSDDCEIGAPYAGELPLQRGVELDSIIRDRKEDTPFFPGGQVRGSTAFVKRPGKMIKSAPQVVNQIAEDQSPERRKRVRDLLDTEHDAVMLGLNIPASGELGYGGSADLRRR